MNMWIFLGIIAVAALILVVTNRRRKNGGSSGIGYPSDHSGKEELETEEKHENESN